MKVFVSQGRAGAAEAAAAGHVAIIIDALRAGATTASFLHFGVREIVVIEGLADALAERQRRADVWLAGERDGLPPPGFDYGNSPLTAPLAGLPPTILFSSSNMSRCCIAAAACPAVFLGALPTRTACAKQALAASRQYAADIHLVVAGSAANEFKLVLEDYIVAGAIIEQLYALAPEQACPTGDGAWAARAIHRQACERGYLATFRETDNGRYLREQLGLGADVEFAAQADILSTVPQLVRTFPLPFGQLAAVLAAAPEPSP